MAAHEAFASKWHPNTITALAEKIVNAVTPLRRHTLVTAGEPVARRLTVPVDVAFPQAMSKHDVDFADHVALARRV